MSLIGRIADPDATGRPVQVLANMTDVMWLPIGEEILWSHIPTNDTDADVELDDGSIIKPGDAGVQYGNIFGKITSGAYAGYWGLLDSRQYLVADPTTAPTLAEGGAGALGAGTWKVGYSYVTLYGETKISSLGSVVIGASKKITVTSLGALPTGVLSVNWYVSKALNSVDVAFLVGSNNNGTGFDINAAGTTPEEPSANTTFYPGLVTAPARGLCAINNRSIFASNKNDSLIGMFDGGLVWKERLNIDTTGLPTSAQVLAAMPQLRYMPSQ